MKRVLLKLKQRFCKHDMQKISIRIEETRLNTKKYIVALNKYDVYECTKCKKREEKYIPSHTSHNKFRIL